VLIDFVSALCMTVRLAELSASCCKELWKDLCCNARKKDLASYANLLSYAKKVFGGSVL
jgi:hypothetical protein